MSAGVEPDATIRIGVRLRAHREEHGIGPEDLAQRLGISRAALYRAEKGEILKVDVLRRIAAELGCGLDQLLGRGSEYYNNGPALFARMAALEADAQSVIGVFGPISYLLTSPAYDRVLEAALHEQRLANARMIADTMAALRMRRRRFASGRMHLRSIVTVTDLEQFLQHGLAGHDDLPAQAQATRLAHARAEVEAIAQLASSGTSDGTAEMRLVEDCGPISSFEIVRQEAATWLICSPFALGRRPNITLGVGMVTPDPDAIACHRAVIEKLWAKGLGGLAAHDRIRQVLDSTG